MLSRAEYFLRHNVEQFEPQAKRQTWEETAHQTRLSPPGSAECDRRWCFAVGARGEERERLTATPQLHLDGGAARGQSGQCFCYSGRGAAASREWLWARLCKECNSVWCACPSTPLQPERFDTQRKKRTKKIWLWSKPLNVQTFFFYSFISLLLGIIVTSRNASITWMRLLAAALESRLRTSKCLFFAARLT